MPRIQRNNVILTVSEDEVPFYIRKGYNLTSPTGEILQAAVPNDMPTLQKAYSDAVKKIHELETVVSRLNNELTVIKRSIETGSEAEPKRKRKKSE